MSTIEPKCVNCPPYARAEVSLHLFTSRSWVVSLDPHKQIRVIFMKKCHEIGFGSLLKGEYEELIKLKGKVEALFLTLFSQFELEWLSVQQHPHCIYTLTPSDNGQAPNFSSQFRHQLRPPIGPAALSRLFTVLMLDRNLIEEENIKELHNPSELQQYLQSTKWKTIARLLMYAYMRNPAFPLFARL